MRPGAIVSVLALCAAAVGRPATAQQPGDAWDFRARGITRPQLEEVLARYEAAAGSPAYSEALRETARGGAAAIRTRLREGDFRVGDRVRLLVEGQAQVSDTFTVSTGPELVLPVIGVVPLSGVLRSELEAALTRSVDRVYRGAVVRARLLTRVAVLGGVGRPGFYALPPEALIEDAITAAGGIAGDARLRDAYVERGRERLWVPDSLQAAMERRLTLVEMGVDDGDRIVIPVPGRTDAERSLRTLTTLIYLPTAFFSLARLFGL